MRPKTFRRLVFIFSWLLLGTISVPLIAGSGNQRPISLGGAIMLTFMGPASFVMGIGSMAIEITGRVCVANCSKTLHP